MQKQVRLILSALVLGTFVLSACAASQGIDSSGEMVVDFNEITDVSVNTSEDNSSDDNLNGNSGDLSSSQELFGIVDAITETTITIDGVEYSLTDFTEFNGTVVVGDQVNFQLFVNADGTLVISEIEIEGISSYSGGVFEHHGDEHFSGKSNSSSHDSNDDHSDDDTDDDVDDDYDDPSS